MKTLFSKVTKAMVIIIAGLCFYSGWVLNPVQAAPLDIESNYQEVSNSPDTIYQITKLDINNCRFTIRSDGQLFTSEDGGRSAFEVPKGSGKTTVYAGNIWLGAMMNDSLYLSGQKFVGDNGFHAGPVCNSANQSNPDLWNRIWKVSKSQIEEHLSRLGDEDYSIPNDILLWPAHGQTQYGMATNLGPFVDANQNGKYEPELGDYPKISGDQAVYIIFNDSDFMLNPPGKHFGFEYHLMAYAYNRPDDPVLNNTVFLKYTIFNRGDLSLENIKLGVFRSRFRRKLDKLSFSRRSDRSATMVRNNIST